MPLISILQALKLDKLHAENGCVDFFKECTSLRLAEVLRRREKKPINILIPFPGLSGDTLLMYNYWLYSNHDGRRVQDLLTARVLASVARPDKQLFPVAQVLQDDALQRFCMSYMCQESSISPGNLNEIYHSAIKFNQPRMKRNCEDFIKTHLVDFEHPRALQFMDHWSDNLITFFADQLHYSLSICENGWTDYPVGKFCLIATGCKKLTSVIPSAARVANDMLEKPPMSGAPPLELLRILVAFADKRSSDETKRVWALGTKLLTQLLSPLDESVAAIRQEVSKNRWDEFILRLKEFYDGMTPTAPSQDPVCLVCGTAFGVFKPRIECCVCKRSFCKKCVAAPTGPLPRAVQSGGSSDKKVCPYCNSVLVLLN